MTTEPQDRGISAVFTDVTDALMDIVRGEAALARAELEENLRRAVTGLVLVIVCVAVSLAALNLLAGAAVAALVAQGMSAGWAALAVAVALLLISAILAALGIRVLAPSNLTLRRTARNVRRDAQTLKEIMTDDTAS
ncbi:phage holin family protein [Defluviimonas sp. SAOS-178_SWC]|uniref:phage holin family protein n=1 Tax=Defluviimonas sp. SAOS-178_SWC TaxID=3121287 RepID=UPI0032218205